MQHNAPVDDPELFSAMIASAVGALAQAARLAHQPQDATRVTLHVGHLQVVSHTVGDDLVLVAFTRSDAPTQRVLSDVEHAALELYRIAYP